jgi:hypothetical protein
MRARWKLLGLAGAAGVAAAGGVVVARSKRDAEEYTPDELRERLHSRLAETEVAAAEPPPPTVA